MVAFYLRHGQFFVEPCKIILLGLFAEDFGQELLIKLGQNILELEIKILNKLTSISSIIRLYDVTYVRLHLSASLESLPLQLTK